jgi:hypothetical protein
VANHHLDWGFRLNGAASQNDNNNQEPSVSSRNLPPDCASPRNVCKHNSKCADTTLKVGQEIDRAPDRAPEKVDRSRCMLEQGLGLRACAPPCGSQGARRKLDRDADRRVRAGPARERETYPVALAERTTLIRRLTLDLIGLPHRQGTCPGLRPQRHNPAFDGDRPHPTYLHFPGARLPADRCAWRGGEGNPILTAAILGKSPKSYHVT